MMKGMVLKDLLVLKSTMRMVIVIIVLFGCMGVVSSSTYMITFASVYAAILPMTCMAYDERCHFNCYAMTLPVSTKDIVLSKYVTGIILALAALAVVLIMTVLADGDIAETVLTAILIPIFYHSLMLPVMFKFGTEKSRIIVMVAIVLPAIAVSFAEQLGWLDNFILGLSGMSEAVLMASVIGVLLVMYITSIFASFAICKNKEW